MKTLKELNRSIDMLRKQIKDYEQTHSWLIDFECTCEEFSTVYGDLAQTIFKLKQDVQSHRQTVESRLRYMEGRLGAFEEVKKGD